MNFFSFPITSYNLATPQTQRRATVENPVYFKNTNDLGSPPAPPPLRNNDYYNDSMNNTNDYSLSTKPIRLRNDKESTESQV